MIQQLRSKLGRLQMLAQKKVGIDPKELHELLREMDIRSGGDGEYWLCGCQPPTIYSKYRRNSSPMI